MGPPADDHDCGWKTRATDLEAKLQETSAKLEEVAAKMAAMGECPKNCVSAKFVVGS